MNDQTRKAANAVVAVTDFFTGALAAEHQAQEVQQKQLDALANQLKGQAELEARLTKALAGAEEEAASWKDQYGRADRAYLDAEKEIARLRGIVDAATNQIVKEKPAIGPEEARRILKVLQCAKHLLELLPSGEKLAFNSRARQDMLVRRMKSLGVTMADLDGVKLDL